VTALPNTGYHFTGWSDGSTAAARTDSNVTGNISVTASFAINTFTLTYTAGSNGTLTGSSPQTVDYNASGTLVTALPNTGYHFTGWSDGSTAAARTDSNVTGNITVSASFAINTFTLTYTAGSNGTLTRSSPQTVDYNASGTLVTALPNTGYHFTGWSDGSTAAARTDSNVTGNITVSASFAINTNSAVTLTLAAPGPASVTLGSTGGVTFSATLSRNDTNAAVVGATISFKVDGNAAGSATTNGSGVATVTTFNPSALTPGSHNAQASFAGATIGGTAFLSATSGTKTLQVVYALSGMCDGDLGHSILQPINADGSSVFKQGSTTPAKFRVCDANGASIGTPGVVTSFNLIGIGTGTLTTVDEAVDSTTPDAAFRWDPTAQQWIFNISTKTAPVNVKNQTYLFQIGLNDGSTIKFQYGLK